MKIIPGSPFLIFLISFQMVSAQETSHEPGGFPQWGLRTSLTSFTDKDAGIMLGINYRWMPELSASFEPTWIFFDPLTRTQNGGRLYPSGIKLRADIRYHFPGKFLGTRSFIGPEFHYKSIRTNKTDDFGINCQNGSCAFFQSAVYRENKKELGAAIKFGTLASLLRNDRLLLEIFTGFGFKRMKFSDTGLPPGGSFLGQPDRNFLGSFFITRSGDKFNAPVFPAGLKLMYLLQ